MSQDAPSNDTPTRTPLNARVTISLYESHFEGGSLIPVLDIEPVGRMTPAAVENLLPLLYREIDLAQGRKARADEAALKERANG